MVAGTDSDLEINNFYSLISEKTKDFVGCDWLYPQIKYWLSDLNSSRYFLITGKAGTGKSSIAARLWEISEGKINDSNLKKDFLSAIHVCVAREGKSTNPISFSNSLAEQLFHKYENYKQEILENIKIDVSIENIQANKVIGIYIENLKIGIRSPNVIFNKIVRTPLENIVKKNPKRKFVFLIDALDESFTKSDSNSILLLLSNLKGLTSSIRFIITTRDDNRFITPFVGGKEISLSDDYFENNKYDIFAFINDQTKKEGKLKNLYNEFPKDLTKKSNGNFLHVKFLIDAIIEDKFIPTKENVDRLQPGLDGLYHDFLKRMKDLDEDKWEKQYLPILHILSISFEGLTESQLVFFTDLKPYDLRQRLFE
jgi:archaellum biogenesis ATPase FlaH